MVRYGVGQGLREGTVSCGVLTSSHVGFPVRQSQLAAQRCPLPAQQKADTDAKNHSEGEKAAGKWGPVQHHTILDPQEDCLLCVLSAQSHLKN